jgi:predicted nucleic-acid-binding protein
MQGHAFNWGIVKGYGRLITRDDDRQFRAAQALLEGGVFVSMGVILECEWVLRFSYDYPRARIHQAFEMIAGIDRFVVEHPRRLDETLTLFSAGLDFADALHLASGQQHRSFATFDRKLCKRAEGLTACQVFTPDAKA